MKILNNLIFVLCIFVSFLNAQEFPKPVGYVNDFADVLTTGEEKTLEALLKNYEEKSTVEIAIVTIKSLDGENIEEYTNKLANEWGVGKKNKDNGIVILNSIGDRKWRIEVGYGLEEFITDAYSGKIGDEFLTPNLKNGEFYKAYRETVGKIMTRLGNLTYEDKERIKEEDSSSIPTWLIWVIIIVVILIIIDLIVYKGDGITAAIFLSIIDGSGGSGGSSGSSFGGGSFGGGGASGGY